MSVESAADVALKLQKTLLQILALTAPSHRMTRHTLPEENLD